jgi:hypothetical protein
VLATGTFAIGTDAFVIGGVLAAVAPGRDQNRTPLTSMFLPGCNMYTQNRVATSQNALAPTFLTRTPLDLPGIPRWIARSVAAVNTGYSVAAVHQGYLVVVRKEGHP